MESPGNPGRFKQLSSMERDAFHVSYLSDKIPEAVFHGQAVKTVAYLRVSTAQQDVRSQRLAILEYARKHDFRIDAFIEATASGEAPERHCVKSSTEKSCRPSFLSRKRRCRSKPHDHTPKTPVSGKY